MTGLVQENVLVHMICDTSVLCHTDPDRWGEGIREY